jgi:signal transduction histidine kinase
MAQRNLDRITEIQYQAQDIMEGREDKVHVLLSLMLEQCADELATLFALETGDGSVVEKVREKIQAVYGSREVVSKVLALDEVVRERLRLLGPSFSHRKVEILTRIEPTPPVLLPPDVLEKVLDGLIRNAVENTPDEGRIELDVQKRGEGSVLVIRDYGIGILEDAKKRIFEGFFSARDTMNYSTKRPFDFGAGGKGADLLRMRIFAERYHFQIDMASVRCRHIPGESDLCPGQISKCRFCTRVEDCHQSGGTVFTVYFPPAPA